MELAVSSADLMLVLASALLGLGGIWHCALMCGSLCAAAQGITAGSGLRSSRPPAALWWPLGARLISYATAGFVAASAGVWLSQRGTLGLPWGLQGGEVLHALWVLAQAGALALGLFLLVKGSQPLVLSRMGAVFAGVPMAAQASTGGARAAAISVVHTPWTRGAAGLAWSLVPCGLLQSALVLATLSSSAQWGALTMLVFGLCTLPGVALGPALMRALSRHRPQWAEGTRLIRVSGGLLAAAAAWTLIHGLWDQARAYC